MKNISPSSLAALFFCLVPFAYANPLGGVVAGGDVNAIINGQGTALTTISQSSDTAIINWNSFNIDGQESTVFQFNGAAGANSAVLNLVNAEAGSSTIAGLLQSTVGANGSIGGTVMILNPAGILFTPTAQVNVGSLVATTLGLADQNEFLNRSTLHFSGDSTAGVTIQNQANINALGDIFLIAHTVQNSGTLTAGNEVGLAAGTTVTLMQSGMERLAVVAGMTTQEQPPVGVNNTEGGQINAVITELKAAGGNIYALAINNGGVVRATGLVNENGRIFFRAIDSSTGRKGVVSSTGTINRTLNIDGPNAPLDVIIEGSQVTLGGTVAISPGTLTVTTASGTGLNDTGDIHINDNTGIMADSVSLHSGVNGTGDISFGSGVTVSADEQFYQAGIGDGTANTAVADLTGNSPAFSGSGNSSPEYFVFQQDATIADANIPAASQFLLNTPPHFYQILSEGGNLTLSSGAKVMGSDLALFAWGTLTIADSLTLNSLYAASADHIVLTGGANSEITTTAGQIYYDGVTLGANMTLNGTAIDFNDTITGAGKNLTLNNSGTATLEGAVSGVDRFFASGSGNLVVNSTVSAGSVTDNETTEINGDSVTTTFGQTYNGAVILGGAGETRTLSGASVNLAGTVAGGSKNLTVNSPGKTTFGNTVSGVNALTTDAEGSTAVNGSISASSVTLNDTIALNNNVTTTAGQTYNGAVTLGGDGTTLTLADTASGNIAFNSTVTGAGKSLTANTAGTTTFENTINGVNALTTDVGGSTVVNNFVSAGSVTLNDTAAVNSDVTTTAGQTYNGAVTLGGEGTTLTLSGVNVNLAGTVTGGGKNLTVNDSGTTTFGNTVSGVNALTTDAAGTTALNGGTVNATVVDFKDDVTLGDDTTISGTTVSFEKTVNAVVPVIIPPPIVIVPLIVKANAGLTVNASGVTTFGGAVGNIHKLSSLTTDAAGTTALNGGALSVVTADFKDDVLLGADTTFDSLSLLFGGGTTTFEKTVNADLAANNRTLTIQTFGTAIFDGAVGNNQALASLTVIGYTTINGGTMTTTGDQLYSHLGFDPAVTLGANTTFNGTALTFGGVNGGGNNLTLNNDGVATFGAVSDVNALTASGSGNLVFYNPVSAGIFNDSEATALNGGSVTTTGAQTYNEDVMLGANTTLTSSGGADITFAGTINGAQALTVNTSGNEIFNGAVGGTTPLTSLTTDGSGTVGGQVQFNSGSVTTTGEQAYNDNLQLIVNTALSGASLGLLGGTTGGGNNLTLNNSGVATLSGALSGVNTLTANSGGSLVVNGTIAAGTFSDSQATTLSGGTVTTSGAQTYNEDVTLGAATTLASSGGADITFAKTINGTQTLTVNTSGNEIFNGAVGDTTPLTSVTTDGAGTVGGQAQLNGGLVATTGGQTYNDNVLLGSATTLSSSGGADIAFAGTINGAQTLAVNSSGNEIFNGAVGGTTPLASLTTDGAGTVGGGAFLNGGSVTTVGSQTYNDNVTLGADTTLNGTALSLLGTVTGGGNDLTFNNSGTATVGGDLSGVDALNIIGSGNFVANGAISAATLFDTELTTFNGGRVTASASQIYGNIVTLGANTTLNLSTLTFISGGAFFGSGYTLIINGVTYTVIGQNETLKRSMLGAILPTYQPIEVRARKPWLHKRQNMPPWAITDPMNSLQVPFD